MKKLIAIAVVFALVAGAAFAEAVIGGSVGFGARLIESDSQTMKDAGDKDPKLFTSLGAHWIGVNFKWTSDEIPAGAKIKINGDMNKSDPAGATPKLGGDIWWQPIPQIKIHFTNVEDEGYLGGQGNAADWGYQSNSAANNVTAFWGNTGGWNSYSGSALKTGTGFFGGIGGGGQNVLLLTVTPVSFISVGFGWDLTGTNSTKDKLIGTVIRAEVKLPNGIGTVGIGFRAKDDYGGKDAWTQGLTAHTLGIDFGLGALQNLGMDIGVGAKIPLGGRDNWGGWDKDADKIKIPMEIGAWFALNQWAGDPLKLFARLGVYLPSNEDRFGARKDITAIGLDVNPSYDIGLFRVHFDVGAAMVLQKNNATKDFFWHFDPYIRKGLGGIGDLYFGINIWNGNGQDGYESIPTIQGKDTTKIVNFAIPLYFETFF